MDRSMMGRMVRTGGERAQSRMADKQRIAELEAQVARLQAALREQNKWWWESVGEGQAADSDDQLADRWGLEPGDLDPVKGHADGE